MSVLFPKVNKPREWDYRPIYYDEEKEARKQKLARLRALREQQSQQESNATNGLTGEERAEVAKDAGDAGVRKTRLHRGSFREAHEAQTRLHTDTTHKSRLAFWIALLAMLILAFYVLS